MENTASGDRRPAHAPLSETPAFFISIGLCVVCFGYWLLLTKVYHFSNEQAAELAAYILSGLTIPSCAVCFMRRADPDGKNGKCIRRSL